MVDAAAKFVFVRSGKLDFSSDLYTLNSVFGKVRGAEEEFDVDMAYGHLLRGMAAARDHELTADLRSGRRTWREYVTTLSTEHSLRIHRGHLAARMKMPAFDSLLRDLDEFAAVLLEDAALMETVQTMHVTASGSAYVVVPLRPVVEGDVRPSPALASALGAPSVSPHAPRPAQARPGHRPKTGFVPCGMVAYPDMASIERFVRLAPPSTEIWLNPNLAAWDCAKFPDLVRARLAHMASALTLQEFLESRLVVEPTADHSMMLLQGLRRGTICVRPDVCTAFAAPRSTVVLPWVASASTPVLTAQGAVQGAALEPALDGVPPVLRSVSRPGSRQGKFRPGRAKGQPAQKAAREVVVAPANRLTVQPLPLDGELKTGKALGQSRRDQRLHDAAVEARSSAAWSTTSVPCTVTSTIVDLIGATLLMAGGWSFLFTSQGRGSRVLTPSGEHCLRMDNSNFFLDLVRGDSLGYPVGSMTVYLPDHPDHVGLRVYPFLVDSGATCSLCTPGSQSLLVRVGSTPPMVVTGVGGGVVFSLSALGSWTFVCRRWGCLGLWSPSLRRRQGRPWSVAACTLWGSRLPQRCRRGSVRLPLVVRPPYSHAGLRAHRRCRSSALRRFSLPALMSLITTLFGRPGWPWAGCAP